MSDTHPEAKPTIASQTVLDPSDGIRHVVIRVHDGKPLQLHELYEPLGVKYDALMGVVHSKLSNFEGKIRANMDAAKGQGVHEEIALNPESLAVYMVQAPTFFETYDAAMQAAETLANELYRRAQGAVDGKKTWVERTRDRTGDPAIDAFTGINIQRQSYGHDF